MTIDYTFLHTVSGQFKAIGQASDLCCTRDMRPQNANYGCWQYQVVYAVRYLPAYYVEYYELAQLLAARSVGSTGLNIASFGAGLCPDYYALQHAMNGVTGFNYWGYDASPWEMRGHMPQQANNFSCLNVGVEQLRPLNVSWMDVFVFPKSLTDIAPTGQLANLAKLIAQVGKPKITFLNSYVRDPGNSSDASQTFDPVHQELSNAGYLWTYTSSVRKICAGHIGTKYPHYAAAATALFCPRQTPLCGVCEAMKNPMAKGDYSSYELREYERP
jgi:hypothetical protein